MAYEQQSDSLRFVQQYGGALEKQVCDAFGWVAGRVVYYKDGPLEYNLQVDACHPNATKPEAFVSVTYCKPDKPGHSNENKLQLKLGELMLLKARFPDIRSILVVGGTAESWAPYILKVFSYFFDKVIFLWKGDAASEIANVREDPIRAIAPRHSQTWATIAAEWQGLEGRLWTGQPIDSSLRKRLWLHMRAVGCEGSSPSRISNTIIRSCMQAAFDRHRETRGKNGLEWYNYVNAQWDKLWQSRSFFNPGEAAIQLSLASAGIAFYGGLGNDVAVPSLIHELGGKEVDNTKVSEDYILYSCSLDRPVFIQSKSTGGGMQGHGKNIQNRTKEQIARSLFYRGGVDGEGNIRLRARDFCWIGVLDGDWGVTQKTPLKYLHMLQWAGYDFLLPADALVDNSLNLLPTKRNPLVQHLAALACVTDHDELTTKWETWLSGRQR